MIKFNKEQIYIVTGASSGIGETTAILLNELGATVVGIGRNQERLEGMKAKCKYPENMFLEQKDLTEDIEGLPKYVKSLKEKYGKFSGMAYCAGIGSLNPIRSIDFEEISNDFNINYFAPIFMMKGIVDKRNNVGEGFSAVLIASIGALTCAPSMTSYSGSKGALISSIKVIAKEIATRGMRANTVSPALIETKMADETSRDYAEGKYPFGLGKTSDVANVIAFLLSSDARWINAQNYIIDCGSEI